MTGSLLEGFPREARLLRPSDYQRVFDGVTCRAGHKHLLILARQSTKPRSRLGLIVAKRHVRTAVARNRIKRLARESFRRRRQQLPALDLVVLARPGVHKLENQTVLAILDDLWSRLEKQTHKLERQVE